jgi:DNA-binding transcriptional MerR regulator
MATAPMASTASATDAAVDLVTIDELAFAVGLTVRTTRYYASLGLIPPPLRRGRVGYYGPQHRARLELIRELQAHGFALTAIERYLNSIPEDASVEEITAQRILLAPWVPEQGEEIDRKSLQERVGRRLDAETLEALTSIGAVEPAGRGRYRTTPALDVAVRLLEMRLPLDSVREAGTAIDRATSDLAEELSAILRRHIVEPYREAHGGATGEDLARTVERLRPLTIQAIVTGFQRAADRIIRQSLGAGR